jgi:hypothetical protein
VLIRLSAKTKACYTRTENQTRGTDKRKSKKQLWNNIETPLYRNLYWMLITTRALCMTWSYHSGDIHQHYFKQRNAVSIGSLPTIQKKFTFRLLLADYFLSFLFNPEDWSGKFLRNPSWLSADYTMSPQKTENFIFSAVRTSSPKRMFSNWLPHRFTGWFKVNFTLFFSWRRGRQKNKILLW